MQLADAPYTPTAADAAVVKAETWVSPSAQSKGRDWVYDAFTPPEIFYNARSKRFTVKPPLSGSEDTPEAPFGLELVAAQLADELPVSQYHCPVGGSNVHAPPPNIDCHAFGGPPSGAPWRGCPRRARWTWCAIS